VLDDTGDFVSTRCNQESVDLEPLVDPKDVDLLRQWVARHLELTGSRRARWILENWYALLPKFIKVYPHEYKRVLGVPRYTGAPLTIASAAEIEQVLHG